MSVPTIQELIDKALVRESHIPSGKFMPSLFGRCFRLQYWTRKNETPSNPPDKRVLRVFKAGNLFHDFVGGLLKDHQREVLVESNDVKGYADFVSDNEVIDIKSQHSKAFWYMKKGDIRKDKYHNWLQVGYYARELKKEFMRLVFISKDDLCVNEYVQKLDDYWLREIHEELLTLRIVWREQRLPPASPRCFINKKGESKECSYCLFRALCSAVELISLEGKNATNHF